MKDKIIVDIGKIMDEFFDAAQNIKDGFENGFQFDNDESKGFSRENNFDYYPNYSYPPANIYLTKDKEMIFEFALAGFNEDNISLEFQGDHMLFAAKIPDHLRNNDGVRYFKRRLKLKDIPEQKYFVPENKFDRLKVSAKFKNGILKITIPPREETNQQERVKIKIHDEE